MPLKDGFDKIMDYLAYVLSDYEFYWELYDNIEVVIPIFLVIDNYDLI
jgi:hypothetical protein